jgi:hypothetical protein
MSYAMTWHIGDGPRHVGRIEVRADAIQLTATAPAHARWDVPYDGIATIELERRVLRLRTGALPEIRISSIDRPGALRELAERIAAPQLISPR